MKYFIIYLLLISPSYAIDVYTQIIKNNPNIDITYAKTLAFKIKSLSNKHNINPNIYTAILAQESMYKLNAKNCVKGLDESYVILTVCRDFGIAQINHKTIELYKFNTKRLLVDLDYSLEAGLIILKDIKRHFKLEKNYWIRYNVGTAKDALTSPVAKEYKSKVTKYMHKEFNYERY